jgi:hypothetical protein
MTIPVICDRCRVAGTAGTGDFSQFGDLLEFEPVPRPARVDGWHAEKQKAFIALLATTGSQRRSAMALGMAPYGAAKLREAEGAEGFSLAWDRALAIAAKNGSVRLTTAVADAAARNAQLAPQPSRLRGIEPGDADAQQDGSMEEKLAVLESIFNKMLGKVEQERQARLAGDVVAADFYLRQVTFFEVAFDLKSEGLGPDAFTLMSQFRRASVPITEIAATPFSMMLDQKRRELWAKMGEPDRPEFPPARYLMEKPGFFTQSKEAALSEEEKELPQSEQERLFRGMMVAEAEAQAEWEAAAHSPDAGPTINKLDPGSSPA